jgi:hypothetical protein
VEAINCERSTARLVNTREGLLSRIDLEIRMFLGWMMPVAPPGYRCANV